MAEYKCKKINNQDWLDMSKNVFLPMAQSYGYGNWHETFGRQVNRYAIFDGDRPVALFQSIKFDLKYNKNYIYIPHGPVLFQKVDDEFWNYFKKFLISDAIDGSTVFVRFDPFLNFERVEDLEAKGFYKTPNSMYHANFHSKFEYIVDISKDIDDIRAGFHRTAKYLINVPGRRGVIEKIIDHKDILKYFEIFCDLMNITAKKGGFNVHKKEYYRSVFDNIHKGGDGFLVVLERNSDVLLANLIAVTPSKEAFFLFGGNKSHLPENKGVSYLGQWTGMTHAKSIGCLRYNFGGFWNSSLGAYPSYKSWVGFSEFKEKFGGSVVEYNDFYDIIVKHFWYKAIDIKRRLDLWR